MCREAVASSINDDNARLASGFFWSILAMMSAPFMVVGAVTFFIVRAVKRSRPER